MNALARLSIPAIGLFVAAAVGLAAEPGDYVKDGHLKNALNLSHVQLGGFAGRLETSIAIGADNAWKGSFGVGRRAKPREGTLTDEQVAALAAALAKHDLAGLPEIIGSAKPVKPPREIADGASTTITLAFGEQKVTANFADGVKVDDATQKLRRRLQAIENAMRQATLNAKQEQ